MGMVACFTSVDDATCVRLKSNPDQIRDFLYPDDGDGEPPHYMDVDKAWHCIHFMLCGSAGTTSDPLSLAFFGGAELGEDVGYGPARLMPSSQVKTIADALAKINENAFKARYSPAAMKAADIYLSDMCVRDGDGALSYLVGNFHSLVAFYQKAAERGDSALLWVS